MPNAPTSSSCCHDTNENSGCSKEQHNLIQSTQASTFATFLGSNWPVRGHCISVQLIGTIAPPAKVYQLPFKNLNSATWGNTGTCNK